MAKRKSKDTGMEEAEVNLTPLVDCVFQLLIFFMVTTVFIQAKGLAVDLPGKAEQEEQQTKKKDVNVIVNEDGSYEIAGEFVDGSQLARRIQELMDVYDNRNVIIQGNKEALHRDVVFVMDIAKSVGAKDIAFATEEEITEVGVEEE